MKKYLFCLSFIVSAAVCTTSCSSDDDNVDEVKAEPVNLQTPKYAQEATKYVLTTNLKASSVTGDITDVPELKSITLSESGNILLELFYPVESKLGYVMENAVVSQKVFTMNGQKVRGVISVKNAALSRASEQLDIDISVSLSKDVTVTYNTGEGTANVSSTTTPTGDEALDHIARTWNVLGAILDLKSNSKNIKAYEEFDSRNGKFYLEDVMNEAIDQGMNISEREQEDLKRVVTNITFTKTRLLIVSYEDGTEDVAEWQWANSEKTAITIHLMDEDMGNKFLTDDTKISVAYNGNRCNLKLDTSLVDDEDNDWEAVLIVRLQE